VLELAANFADLLALSLSEQRELEVLKTAARMGARWATRNSLALVERKLGRTVRRGKPGPKPKREPR
jgi:REP-associated tyrosine transposase